GAKHEMVMKRGVRVRDDVARCVDGRNLRGEPRPTRSIVATRRGRCLRSTLPSLETLGYQQSAAPRRGNRPPVASRRLPVAVGFKPRPGRREKMIRRVATAASFIPTAVSAGSESGANQRWSTPAKIL